jgi:hypothetical protein
MNNNSCPPSTFDFITFEFQLWQIVWKTRAYWYYLKKYLETIYFCYQKNNGCVIEESNFKIFEFQQQYPTRLKDLLFILEKYLTSTHFLFTCYCPSRRVLVIVQPLPHSCHSCHWCNCLSCSLLSSPGFRTNETLC